MRHRFRWMLAPVVLFALAIPAASEDDEPVSVPFEDMTEEEWAEREARNQAYQSAAAQWNAYYLALCDANAQHERELRTWREAMDAFLLDPSLASPGDRPELRVPPAPSVAQPGAYEPPAC